MQDLFYIMSIKLCKTGSTLAVQLCSEKTKVLLIVFCIACESKIHRSLNYSPFRFPIELCSSKKCKTVKTFTKNRDCEIPDKISNQQEYGLWKAFPS